MKVLLILCITLVEFIYVSAQNVNAIGAETFYASTSGCTQEDFNSPNVKCEFSCYLELSSKVIHLWSWFSYFSIDSSTNVTIFDNVTKHHSNNNYSITLQLGKYFSGSYQCVFEDHSPRVVSTRWSHTFQVATAQGKKIGEECENYSQCLALNAECAKSGSSNRCACSGIYQVPYNNNPFNPACLKHEKENGFCNIDSECTADHELLYCDHYHYNQGECRCGAHDIYVEDEEKTMCINFELPLQPCSYDEECHHRHSEDYASCINNTCACGSGYSLNRNLDSCIESKFDIITSSECEERNLSDGSMCQLTCSIQTTLNINRPYWIYKHKTGSTNDVILIGSDSYQTNDDDSHITTLNLTNYSAGYYACVFQLSSTDNNFEKYLKSFKIEKTIQGINYWKACNKSEECLTLNSQCLPNSNSGKKHCACPAEFNILYHSTDVEKIACLKPSGYMEPCNIDSQCKNLGSNYKCKSGKCQCAEHLMNVSAEGGRARCLTIEGIYGACEYNEQCTYIVNTKCIEGRCNCGTGYRYSLYDNECILNLGSKFGIIIACMSAVICLVWIVSRPKQRKSCLNDVFGKNKGKSKPIPRDFQPQLNKLLK